MKELKIIFNYSYYMNPPEPDISPYQDMDKNKLMYKSRIPFEICYEAIKIKTLIESFSKKDNEATESEKIIFINNASEYLRKSLPKMESYDIFKINFITELIELKKDMDFDKSNPTIIFSVPVNDKLYENLFEQMNEYLHIIEYFKKAKNFVWDSIVGRNISTLNYRSGPLRSCLDFIDSCYNCSIDSYHLKTKISEINSLLNKLYLKKSSNMHGAKSLFDEVLRTFSYLNDGPEIFSKKPFISVDLKKFII